MFWSASRLMSKPVRLLARRTDSYVHAHAVLRSPMRLFGAVAGASADSYDAGDDNDGIGNGAGVGSDAGAAADSGHAGTVAFAGTSAGTFTRRLTLPMWFARAGCGGFVSYWCGACPCC